MEFRLLNYNIYIRPPGRNERGDDYKDERLNQFIENHMEKYDLIAFEELFGCLSWRRQRTIEEAKKRGLLYSAYIQYPYWPLYPIDGGVCILSKYPIVETEQMIYTRGVYQDWLLGKGLLYTKLQIEENKYLHLFGTHYQADYYDTWEKNAKSRGVRNIQIKECFDFIKRKTSNDNHPIMLCGDLNINGGSREYDELLAFIQSDEYKFRVRDVLFEQYNEHPCTFNEMVDGHKVDEVITTVINESGCPLRLDYILFLNSEGRQQLDFKDCQVQKFHSTEGSIFPFLSDHYGIETTIIYPQ